MKFYLFIALLAVSFVVLPVYANTSTLTVCSYSEFKPVSYGNGKGYEADLLRAIAKKSGMQIKFYPQSIYEGIWLLPSQKNAKCDIAAGGITPSTYRKEQGAVFTRMTVLFSQSLLVRRKDFESGRITSFKAFKEGDIKIGVVPGTTGERYAHVRARENGVPLSVFVQYKSESELLPALKGGKIDAIARGEIGNEYQAMLDKSVITIAKKNFNEGFSFALKKGNSVLLNKLNRYIHEMTNNTIVYKI